MKIRRILLIFLLLFLYLFFPSFLVQSIALLGISVLLLSYGYSKVLYKHITVEHTRTLVRTYKNQRTKVEILVYNWSILPVHYFSVVNEVNEMYSDNEERFLISLKGREKKQSIYYVQSGTRGSFFVGPVTIKGSDPLGLFPWKKRVDTTMQIIVYPGVHLLDLLFTKGLPAGNLRIQNPIYEDVTRYRSIREYIPGDDTRRINWKVSARMGKLHSMEFLPALYFPALILLNLTVEDFTRRHRYEYIERAIETSASLIFYAVNLGQEVGIISSGLVNSDKVGIPLSNGHSHAVAVLEALALISPNKNEADCTHDLFASHVNIPYGCRVMYVGPSLREDQIERLLIAKQGGANVELYIVGSEQKGSETIQEQNFPIYSIKEYGSELIRNE
ncbi:MAG: DUF58 domain-containing protein [Spirochaetia bacterium]